MWKGRKYDPYRITSLSRNSRDRLIKKVVLAIVVIFVVAPLILASSFFAYKHYNMGVASIVLFWGLIPVIVKLYSIYLNKEIYKVRDCKRFFHMAPVKDTDVMDSWYKDGGIVINVFENKYLDLFYNWLRDCDMLKKDDVTLYTFTREQFMSRYSFHDGSHIKGDKFAVLPIKDIGGSMNKLKALWRDHDYFYRFTDFNSMVNGTYYISECGLQHRFKDKIENFISYG